MTNRKYREHPGINYSSLADWHQNRCLPTARAMKPEYVFGHAFEALIQDIARGTTAYNDGYFSADPAKSIPEEIYQALEDGADLDALYVRTKSGAVNGQYKARHGWIDACLANPGKVPLTVEDDAAIRKMAENFMAMEVDGVGRVSDILPHCQFQEPIFWSDKKCLCDCLISTSDGAAYLFDIKTAASIGHFVSMLKSRYWIQDLHYSEGVNAEIGECERMIFLVATKSEPFVCQSFGIHPDSRLNLHRKYLNLVNDFRDWKESGAVPVGFKPFEDVYVY